MRQPTYPIWATLDPEDRALITRFDEPLNEWDHIDIAMVRDRRPFLEDEFQPAGPRIQLGAGFKHIKGYANLEYPDWDADLPIPNVDLDGHGPDGWKEYRVASAKHGRGTYVTAGDESVAEFISYHTLDHLMPEQVIYVLSEVNRTLKPGGVFTNIVPHYGSQLANECIMHRSRFAIDTWRNIFSERQYKNVVDGSYTKWKLHVRTNFIYGITERNLVLVTQLQKEK